MAWRLADRTLDLARPIGAGIVNVTVDSMFEGARSGTPEQAVADGLALAVAGFEMLDLGAVAAKSGPPVSPEDEAAALAWPFHGRVLRRPLRRAVRASHGRYVRVRGASPLRGRGATGSGLA